MPQKKKQLRFKIPWISSSGARAPPSKQKSKPERPPFRPPGIAPAPALPHSSPSSQSQQQQEREAPSHPAQSPASSVILDSPVSSPSESPSRTPHSAEFKKEPEEAKEIVLVMEHEASKEESIERKMMFATSSSSGKDIKVVSNSGNTSTMNVTSTTIPLKEEKQHHVNNQLQKGIKENISCFVQKLATVTPTQPPTEVDDDHKSFSVVTLAGDNKGATMHVAEGSSNKTKKDGSIRIHRAYKKKNPEEEEEETTDAGDENDASASEKKDDDDDDDVAANKAYVNSNIQSVNNSVMVQGSVSERDPGVRVALPNYQQSHGPKAPALETRRVEMNGNRVSYPRPVVRRRCLRGLFMEPSDSEPDNPDKPRRHGCKFRCGDNNKAADIM